ncbi:MAG: hypothetical protein ACLP8X_01800 [Streptosporangiaceae bacterium]
MNSAAGSALIAGILSGVFVIVGVLLGTWLQGRSTDREHERAAAATRDEILAALGAAVITLLTQAEVWHHTAARRRNLTQVPGNLAELTGGPPDPRAIQLAGELERLRHAMIPVTNEISLYTNRLNLSDPALRPQVARLMAAVRAIVANMGGHEDQFRDLYDKVVSANRALRHKRDELAEQDRPQGRRARRRQHREGEHGYGELGGHAHDDPPDGKPGAS